MGNRDDRNSGMGRNYDSEFTIGHICDAVQTALDRGSDTADKLHSVLVSMSEYMRVEYDLRDMDKITLDQYEAWANSLVERVDAESLSAGTAVDYISAANSMWQVFGAGEGTARDLHIDPSELGLSKERITNEDKSIDRETFDALRSAAYERWSETGDVRDGAVYHAIGVGWETGQRLQEILVNHIGGKDLSGNIVHLADRIDGAKNGQGREYESVRELNMSREAQAFLKEHAHIFMGGNFIPADATYTQMENYANNRLREYNEQTGNTRMWHGLRHSYAHESYSSKWEQATGHKIEAPVKEGLFGSTWIRDVMDKTGLSYREIQAQDRDIRLAVAEELGHHRSEVSSAYLGR